MNPGKRKRIFIALAVAGVAVLGGAWYLLITGLTSGDELDQDAIGRSVASALRALPQDPSAGVASDSEPFLKRPASHGLPRGTTLDPIQESWAPEPSGGGTMLVRARFPDGERQWFLAVIAKEHGEWKVESTFEVGEADAP